MDFQTRKLYYNRCDPFEPLAPGDARNLIELAKLLSREQPLVDLPLLPEEPTDLESLEALGRQLESRLGEWERYVSRTS